VIDSTDKNTDRLRSRSALLAGISLLLAGFALNPFALTYYLPSGRLESPAVVQALIGLQVALMMVGGWLLWRGPRLSPLLGVGASILLSALVVCGLYGTGRVLLTSGQKERLLTQVDRGEALILWLEARVLPVLAQSIRAQVLPDSGSESLFAERVHTTDLAPLGEWSATSEPTWSWSLEESRFARAQDLRLWHPFLALGDSLQRVNFSIEEGYFIDANEMRFQTLMRFTGNRQSSDASLVHAAADLQVLWQKYPIAGSDSTWRIAEWHTTHFKTETTARPLFVEALVDILPDRTAREHARRSLHEELVIDALTDPDFRKPHGHFTLHAFDRHPGVSVVDINGDGLDDIYIMARWGENQLLVNQGNGTYAERAAEFGLNIADHSAAALFADFDNDGDSDVFLGRTLEPSMYLVNEHGRFVDRSDQIEGGLPQLVASIAAADVDGDGLLDVYFSTYAARIILEAFNSSPGRLIATEALLGEFISPSQARKLHRLVRKKESDLLRDAPGPPNSFFKNSGDGRFVAVEGPLSIWRNTLQAAFGDYDSDGDPDLYLANDFAANNLLRNEGDGRFIDVTARTATADLGFGMGASWGDYDRDGRQDLYVTNMYSRAGRRITALLDATVFAPLARGNSLFRNLGDEFARVSGVESPALLVERGGWGWGSQFADLNNDGYLDIYALSGFYTAPEEVAIVEDT